MEKVGKGLNHKKRIIFSRGTSKILIPIIIVVIGIIIAGAIIYIGKEKGNPPGGSKTAEQFISCLDSGKFVDKVKKDFQEVQGIGVSGTPTFLISGEKLVGAQPFLEFQKIIEDKLKSGPQDPGVPIEGDPVLGSSNAPVTMVEISDFQCPFCGKYARETFPQIKKEYVDTGKVKIIFKNFPLPMHPNAQKAAEAAECAADQGKFWEYKEKLFANQNNLSVEDLKKYAQESGLK